MGMALALSLRRILRFSAIGVAGLASWLVAEYSSSVGTIRQSTQDSIQTADPFAPILVGMGVVKVFVRSL